MFNALPDSSTPAPESAEAVWKAANYAVNGAYSIFPGIYNAGRAVARGTRLMGPEEYRRFDQEVNFIGNASGEITKHPELAYRAGQEALAVLARNPYLIPYFLGRVARGGATMLGPAALAGDTLRAIEDGHDLLDAVLYQGLQGIPDR
ncbi:MAG: hypothetical protein JO339_29135 [Alphaproteobacteria bacterium]|nr:hypothetical protein [Alphaproteobacteria bacterium]